jgi:hypothetical protein
LQATPNWSTEGNRMAMHCNTHSENSSNSTTNTTTGKTMLRLVKT